ncbi:hypothetical protein CesoFtcFv8_010620 [Champsocephalus esox]|uniref:Uncharacterized protein n=1 Tax=Champsocephalus esox TaxID=159716 RepID=A0AAN8C5Q0_9TELE|nr:hypothetical protein CesoFtcFv8_010620 [Champsocephalus esox]
MTGVRSGERLDWCQTSAQQTETTPAPSFLPEGTWKSWRSHQSKEAVDQIDSPVRSWLQLTFSQNTVSIGGLSGAYTTSNNPSTIGRSWIEP